MADVYREHTKGKGEQSVDLTQSGAVWEGTKLFCGDILAPAAVGMAETLALQGLSMMGINPDILLATSIIGPIVANFGLYTAVEMGREDDGNELGRIFWRTSLSSIVPITANLLQYYIPETIPYFDSAFQATWILGENLIVGVAEVGQKLAQGSAEFAWESLEGLYDYVFGNGATIPPVAESTSPLPSGVIPEVVASGSTGLEPAISASKDVDKGLGGAYLYAVYGTAIALVSGIGALVYKMNHRE